MSEAARRLVTYWRERIHPKASAEQVAIAFALLAGGAMLAVLGVLVFSFGDVAFGRTFWLRELGIVAAAAGLPLFLMGLVVAIPAKPWLRALAATGWALVSVALVLFVWWYPHQWNLTVQWPNGFAIGAYLLGVTSLAGASSAAVAAYFVDRSRPTLVAGDGFNPYAEQDTPVTRDEIEADLAWADRQGWGWGGMRERHAVKLAIRDEPDMMEFLGQGDRVKVLEAPAEQDVRAALALASLRGRTSGKAEDPAVNDQVQYLKRLQAQQSEEERQRKASLWYKITHQFG